MSKKDEYAGGNITSSYKREQLDGKTLFDFIPEITMKDIKILESWQAYFTKWKVPHLVTCHSEQKIDNEGNPFKFVHWKLWKAQL